MFTKATVLIHKAVILFQRVKPCFENPVSLSLKEPQYWEVFEFWFLDY